jgi:hypothetical protein
VEIVIIVASGDARPLYEGRLMASPAQALSF